jgi:hypothetical protein
MAEGRRYATRRSICSDTRAPENFDLNPENGSYFSIDSGNTNINTFNGTGGGDLSDWLGLTPDAFNHSLSRGFEEPFTAGDLTLMDVIGYDPAVPEPGTLALLAVPLIGPWSIALAPDGALGRSLGA